MGHNTYQAPSVKTAVGQMSALLAANLHFARLALGSEHLRMRDQMLSLRAPQVWIDVEAFGTENPASKTALGLL